MKRPIKALLPLLIISLLTSAARAEEASGAEGTLDAAHGIIEQKSGNWHFWEKVHLVYPGVLDLTCEDMQVTQTTDGGGKSRPDRIRATTNVLIAIVLPASTNAITGVIKPGGLAHASAPEAVFNGTDNTVTLIGTEATGLPTVVTSDGTFVGPKLTFDRGSGRFSGTNGFHMTFKAEMLKSLTAKTNAPAAR